MSVGGVGEPTRRLHLVVAQCDGSELGARLRQSAQVHYLASNTKLSVQSAKTRAFRLRVGTLLRCYARCISHAA